MSPYDPQRHGPRRLVGPGFHAEVHALVRRVPAGSVTTYGDLGERLGSRGIARHVGHALAAVSADSDVPWWRVVAAGGRLALAPSTRLEQAQRLMAEGLVIRADRVVEFARHRWHWR